ncbi:MAG: class F sortase [Actinobacteria bacterium]|nr:class F sortase [Actinomycetota bacterium]
MRRCRAYCALSVAGVVLAISGAAAVAVAMAGQGQPPLPTASAAGSIDFFAGSGGDLVLAPSPPLAIDVPAIGVHSNLQHLGVTAENTPEVPAPGPHYDEAAWFKYSPAPGSVGAAVILGHVDSATGGRSVFFNLGLLRPGDEVLVTRSDGSVAVFTVDGVRRYPKDEFPSLTVYGGTAHPALRLITCGGEFDRADGHYRDNIVVFASLTDTR